MSVRKRVRPDIQARVLRLLRTSNMSVEGIAVAVRCAGGTVEKVNKNGGQPVRVYKNAEDLKRNVWTRGPGFEVINLSTPQNQKLTYRR